jgi:hypothetical protein
LIVALLLVLLSVVGLVWPANSWGWRVETVDFSSLQNADTVNLRIANQSVRTISEADSVHAVTDFVRFHQDQWGVPWYGVPVGRVELQFFGQGRYLGDLGVGRGFLKTQQKGAFYSRSTTVNDQQQILGLLGLTPQDLG